VLAFSVFPSAVLVGDPAGSTRVISLAAYREAFERYDYSMGSAIAMVMAGVELLVIGFVLALRSRFYRGAPTSGKG
jgi:putative spermidine/putrescine transport system permease protein